MGKQDSEPLKLEYAGGDLASRGLSRWAIASAVAAALSIVLLRVWDNHIPYNWAIYNADYVGYLKAFAAPFATLTFATIALARIEDRNGKPRGKLLALLSIVIALTVATIFWYNGCLPVLVR